MEYTTSALTGGVAITIGIFIPSPLLRKAGEWYNLTFGNEFRWGTTPHMGLPLSSAPLRWGTGCVF